MITTTRKDTHKMQDIDLCMLKTTTGYDMLVSRRMTNGDLDYDGSNYLFALEDSRTVKDIKGDSFVNLTFQGKNEAFVSVAGRAGLVSDRQAMERHWIKPLDKWFEKGLDTPGVVMVVVMAEQVKYWQHIG